MKILILGHNGLLGNTVHGYLKDKYEIITTNLKWDTDEFKNFILNSNADYIINCIGKIPQKKPTESDYNKVNYELPKWLDSLGVKIIHPDTDENGNDPYSISKKKFRNDKKINTKFIRTSIIGPESKGNYSLMDWFLSSEGGVKGFTNQFWNGNTTLEWAKWSNELMKKWDEYYNITLSNPECLSKYEILNLIKEVFDKDIEIIPKKSKNPKNNCLSGIETKLLKEQLIELKEHLNN